MTTSAFDEAFEKVKSLASKFHDHEDRYCSSDYKEADVRLDFIDPFLDALGWKRSQNPYQQELKVEHHAHSGTQGRADYAFYVAPRWSDGDVRFFLEAKKPHDNIATAGNYLQTISYGYSSRRPLAVLTDFEQFHILDCRYEPKLKTALDHCLEKFHYTDYADRDKFAKIYWLFSREAFTSGAFDAYTKQLRGKKAARAPKPVDESLLERLDELRNALAHAFKNNNPELDSEALTEFAQRTLDRLVFLRFLEDKGIEREGAVNKLAGSATAWRDFIARCRQLDSIYNGIIYRQQPMLDGPTFRMDNAAFANVCKRLAHGDTDYNFNFDFIPIHILGSIYERFLGKVIVATDKRVRVEDKPEVRKAGGVYYTPEYIVHYIVENTVGKLIAGKTPGEIAEMRFADIACGSGSFLLGVYDLLLTYHGTWYNANPSKARKGDCIEHDGKLYLSLARKRDILVKNIYGVDIDAQAAEVCQLSLCLKLLKDESPETTAQYLMDFEHTAQMRKLLPDLSKNIVCGNSLIERDIFDGQLPFEATEEKKLNPMDFENRFQEIMKRGGFDAIIGNPPWISLSGKFGNEFLPPVALEYLISRYEGNTYMPNMYEYFVAKGLTLTRKDGLFGYIVPDRLGFNSQFLRLRQRILTEARIETLQYKVPFPGITADTLVFVFRRGAPGPSHEVEISEFGQTPSRKKQAELLSSAEHRFEYKIDTKQDALSRRIEATPSVKPLSEVASCTSGFGGKSQLITGSQVNKSQIRTLKGDSIGRYLHRKGYWFEFRKENITGRTTDRKKLGAKPKILLRKTGDSIIATFDDSGIFPEQSLYFLFAGKTKADFKYLLGLINSKLLNWFFKKNCLTNERSIAQVKTVDLVRLPVRTIDFSQLGDKTRHDRMVALVEQMLAAKKELAGARTDKDRTYYGNKCADLDSQIDRLVYDLYGLTEAEIKIVKDSAHEP